MDFALGKTTSVSTKMAAFAVLIALVVTVAFFSTNDPYNCRREVSGLESVDLVDSAIRGSRITASGLKFEWPDN